MKLPRWLVIAMLTTSMLSVLAAAGWWWVTWPERTARQFVYYLGKGSYEEQRQMLKGDPKWTSPSIILERQKREWKSVELTPQPRTLRDILFGRQDFKFHREGPSLTESATQSTDNDFVIKRGKLVGVEARAAWKTYQ